MAKISLTPKQLRQMIYLVAKMKSDGESLDNIRSHFVKRGLPEVQIDNIIAEAIAKEQKEEDKERKRSKQMIIVGLITLLLGLFGLAMTHYELHDMMIMNILCYMLVLFGLANIVYGKFSNPDFKKKRDAKKTEAGA